MKKQILLSLFALLINTVSFAQWHPVGDKIKTDWAKQINPNNVLPEYPRPIMERDEWKNLNGLWNYAITEVGDTEPILYDGQILVPFPIESSLSGVGKMIGSKKELWYQKNFDVSSVWKGKK